MDPRGHQHSLTPYYPWMGPNNGPALPSPEFGMGMTNNGTALPSPEFGMGNSNQLCFPQPQDVVSLPSWQPMPAFNATTNIQQPYPVAMGHPGAMIQYQPTYWMQPGQQYQQFPAIPQQLHVPDIRQVAPPGPPASPIRPSPRKAKILSYNGGKIQKKSEFQALKKAARARKCRCPRPAVPPRPSNAFMCFRAVLRPELVASGVTDEAEISSKTARVWKTKTSEEKAPFVAKSKALAEQQLREFPDYKYRPNQKSDNDFGYPSCKCGAYQENMESLRARFPEAAERQEMEFGELRKTEAKQSYSHRNCLEDMHERGSKRKRADEEQPHSHGMSLRKKRKTISYAEVEEEVDTLSFHNNSEEENDDDGNETVVLPPHGRRATTKAVQPRKPTQQDIRSPVQLMGSAQETTWNPADNFSQFIDPWNSFETPTPCLNEFASTSSHFASTTSNFMPNTLDGISDLNGAAQTPFVPLQQQQQQQPDFLDDSWILNMIDPALLEPGEAEGSA